MSMEESGKYHLEKAQETFFETGKRLGNGVLMFLLTISIAVLISFSEQTQGGFSVPALGLKLPQWLAAEVVLVLACAAWLKVLMLTVYQRVVLMRVDDLLKKGDWENTTWYLYYPSFFSIFMHLENFGLPGKIFHNAFNVLFLLGGFIVPIALLAYIGYESEWNAEWVVACLVCTTILTGAGLIAGCMPDWDQKGTTLGNLNNR